MNPAKDGKLSVRVETGQAVIEVRDWQLKVVAQGVTPLDMKVEPGLYSVTARQPGKPVVRRVTEVKPAEKTVWMLSGEGEEQQRRLSPLLTRTSVALPNFLAMGLATPVATPTSASVHGPAFEERATPAAEPQDAAVELGPTVIGVRFRTLKTWSQAEEVGDASATISGSGADAALLVRSAKASPLILQIARRGKPVLNVVLPSKLMNSDEVRVTLNASSGRLKPTVELNTGWANIAAQFVEGGYLREAKQLVKAEVESRRERRLPFVHDLALRFRDITGISYLPYLVLRLTAPENLRTLPASVQQLPERLLKSFASLADAQVVAAEIEARLGEHATALAHLLELRPGQFPVFTDGFSILISRLRSYSERDANVRPAGIDEESSGNARALLEEVSRWSRYADFTALTLTFTGADVAQPSAADQHEALDPKDWSLLPLESDAVDFNTVKSREAEQIRERRQHHKLPPEGGFLGVAFSGGGIRSGTFNLGILQGLANSGFFLPKIDYLSTVSGGGYIGTWFHGIIRECGKGKVEGAADVLSRPENKPHTDSSTDPIEFLRKYSSYLAPSLGLFSADFWSILVIWMRNMLLNQLIIVPLFAAIALFVLNGGFVRAWLAQRSSPPAGTLWGSIVAAVCLLGAVMITARGLVRVDRGPAGEPRRSLIDRNLGGIFCVALVVVASCLIACMSSTLAAFGATARGTPEWTSGFWKVAGGFCVSAGLLLLLLQGRGGFLSCYWAQHPGRRLRGRVYLFLFSFIAGTVAGLLLYASVWWIASWEKSAAGSWHVVAWGTPLILLVWLAGAGTHIGLMGADFPDFGREWLARIGAFLAIAAFSWALVFTLVVFGPFWLSDLALRYGKTAASMTGAWIATSVAGVLAGRSERTSGSPDQTNNSAVLEWIGKIAPTVFLVGFLLLVSFGVYAGLRAISGARCGKECGPAAAGVANPQKLTLAMSSGKSGDSSVRLSFDREADTPDWLQWLVPLVNDYWCVLGTSANASASARLTACPVNPGVWRLAFGFLIGSVMVVVFLSWRVDINEFSMHHFYKNRLVRCYLGAGRGSKRHPSGLTGFDPCDDFPLASLLAKPDALPADGCRRDTIGPYGGPYPIINGTVNLDRGSDLAKQERQGESFIFTPLYCGFDPPRSQEDKLEVGRHRDLSENGYRLTWNYLYPKKGPNIGTCMAISGAAANPNRGFSTSKAVAFLLTIFDVRLGWWVGNPRRNKRSRRSGPGFALRPLLSDLFAQTDSRAHYLNISDGGHFENLGLYELVRRRCRYIIAGDGEQDPDLNFESLGGAVRKCRTDFGVDILIDPRRIRAKDGFSQTHCVVGRILYPPDSTDPFNPKGEPGWLLYLKASLTGDEPEDVTQYHAVHTDFPQQPTPNQFFTESQFEAYRKLGLHVFESALENIDLADTNLLVQKFPLDEVFERLYQRWYPPSEIADGVASRHADAYSALMRRLSTDPELRYLDEQILCPPNPQERAPAASPPEQSPLVQRTAFFFCLELIQLMENVWSDLHMFNAADRENPKNQGWITVFQWWARQPIFRDTWEKARNTYNSMFQQFFDSMASGEKPKLVNKYPGRLLPHRRKM